MKSEIEEIFPKLDKIPESIAATFEAMIRCYLQTKHKTPELEKVRGFKRLGLVFDEDNRHVCFFKASEDAKKEAAVYLLDHPLDSHRSSSSDLIGFGGATPTVFIKTKEASGCLISFVEHDRPVGKFSPLEFKTLSPEIQKLCIFHIRFGSADCHGLNTISKIDAEGIHRLTPIDHEECFTSDVTLISYALVSILVILLSLAITSISFSLCSFVYEECGGKNLSMPMRLSRKKW